MAGGTLPVRTSVAPLFVPGHVERLREKAASLGTGTLLVDLEDAVPADRKAAARRGALDLIRRLPGRCLVRINPLTGKRFGTVCGEDDVAAVTMPGLLGIVGPKIEDADELLLLDAAVARAEHAAGIAAGTVGLFATIESPHAIMNLAPIAGAVRGRSVTLSFGMGDFTTALDVEWTADETETAVPRALVPIASQAAGLAKPLDSVFTDVDDLAGLRASAERGRRLGYGGKAAIHPAQIAVIRAAYRPTAAQVARAQRIVDAAPVQAAQGNGAFLLDGEMIDEPVVVRAQALLATAGEDD